MKIIWVDRPMQDSNTLEPQLIDGEIYNWCVKTRKLHCTSLQEELQKWKEHDVHSDAKYILIHEVSSAEKLFCDQDCKPNEPGCRSKYVEDNHALMLRYDIILNQNKDEQRRK
jgi:hypothetical protein